MAKLLFTATHHRIDREPTSRTLRHRRLPAEMSAGNNLLEQLLINNLHYYDFLIIYIMYVFVHLSQFEESDLTDLDCSKY